MMNTTPAPLRERLGALLPDEDWGVHAANLILAAGLESGASDLHLLPMRDGMAVRLRRDDALEQVAVVPAKQQELLLARLKVMAKLQAFIRHEPQDGAISFTPSGAAPQLLRVAFLPTLHGEAVTIRYPEKASQHPTLSELGMPPALRGKLLRLLNRREGILLTTGPSGSGKTTTLHALLRHLADERGDRLSFFTIEDPVESALDFAAQVPVNPAQGLTFERALRATLRQSPSVLLIGEIRDAETARIAMQAGMTGHLVLSSLHAGRAVQVPARLLSMGIEPFMVASALSGSLAQRLIRLCNPVRRTGIFELLPMTEALRGLVLAQASPAEFAAEARQQQLGDLLGAARELQSQGLLSSEELELTLGEELP